MDADGCPSFLQQDLDVGITEWSELVNESIRENNWGNEPRVSRSLASVSLRVSQ